MNTTFTNEKSPEISFENILDAVHEVQKTAPMKYQEFEMCKKHFRLLAKQCRTYGDDEDPVRTHKILGDVASLFGIKVKIRPYLKKIRLYTYDSDPNKFRIANPFDIYIEPRKINPFIGATS